jgi:sugar lactone lactonase YvrE
MLMKFLHAVTLLLILSAALVAGAAFAVADDAQPPGDNASQPQYPIAVAVDGGVLYVVDLNLPGVWKVQGDQRDVFALGERSFRTPLNRPRCVAIHPQGGILVGDSATREVYHITSQDAQPMPLSSGRIGTAMALAISPDQQTVYIGDAETRAVLRMPITGGDPQIVVNINARGLAFDDEGALWAVTPDDAAIHRIDVQAKTNTAVITGRPYQYPGGLAWAGNRGFVTDSYGGSVWTFTPDGKTELWFEGPPLAGPVGMAAAQDTLWIADPKARQVFQFDQRQAQEPRPRL